MIIKIGAMVFLFQEGKKVVKNEKNISIKLYEKYL